MPKLSPLEDHFFTCDCSSDEHTMRFVFDPNDSDFFEVYATFHLNTYDNIFKRIWTAIKYVFGYKSKYGQWDTWIMNRNDVERLSDLLERMKESAKKAEEIKNERGGFKNNH